jgi:hypothetical protein
MLNFVSLLMMTLSCAKLTENMPNTPIQTTHDFFDKEHILISRRYQLYLAFATKQCPSDNKNAHS